MSQDLLASAIVQAELAPPAVKAAALLHIARVVATSDSVGAEEMLERGIALAQELSARDRPHILANAVYLAAAVSPKMALKLYPDYARRHPHAGGAGGMLNAMAEHGHVRDVIAYLDNLLSGGRYPLHMVGNFSCECRDDESRLQLFRSALRAWRKDPNGGPGPSRFGGTAFVYFFANSGHLLPPEERAEIRGEIELWVRRARESGATLPPLPDLESPRPAPPYRGRRTKLPPDEDIMMGGHICGTGDDLPHSQIMYMDEALKTDFQAAFAEAFAHFAADTDADNPNQAPKECWPSADDFRTILFKAGQHLDVVAAKYLVRISDPDLRLFAQIELCAAIAGLPQIGATIVFPRRMPPPSVHASTATKPDTSVDIGGDRDTGGPFIRCPKCRWAPQREDRWVCHCHQRWNTFDTGGICPGCHYQWTETMCPRCHQWSPHSDWYAHKG